MMKTTLFLVLCDFFLPFLLLFLKNKRIRNIVLWVYILCVVFFTIISRFTNRDYSAIKQTGIVFFYSYSLIDHADIRWQIYENILMFFPFGFMLPWATEKGFLKTMLIGCCFSIIIETTQYFFRLGMCEMDDVIHNTLGTAIGFGYWRLLQVIKERVKNKTSKNDKAAD